MFLIGPYSYPAGTMLSASQRVGVTSGLVLCLDAGDINSYDGTSQTWTDVSGNSNNFYRGSGSGSDSFDPTFHGSAGGQSSSEYFSSGGSSCFFQAGSWTFANSWHKDNATFTVASWVWVPSGATNPPGFILLRNIYDTADAGMSVQVTPLSSNGFVGAGFTNGAGGQFSVAPAVSDTIVEGTWMFAAISISEGSGASFIRENGYTETIASDTYTSPSSSNPNAALMIWGFPDSAGTGVYSGASNGLAPSGSRINSLMAWNRALSQAEVTALYNSTKSKFGL